MLKTLPYLQFIGVAQLMDVYGFEQGSQTSFNQD